MSYTRRAEPRPAAGADAGVKAPEMGTITGSEADLRKLGTKEAAVILRQFGVDEKIIASVTDR